MTLIKQTTLARFIAISLTALVSVQAMADTVAQKPVFEVEANEDEVKAFLETKESDLTVPAAATGLGVGTLVLAVGVPLAMGIFCVHQVHNRFWLHIRDSEVAGLGGQIIPGASFLRNGKQLR
jgi:hypothetical protein